MLVVQRMLLQSVFLFRLVCLAFRSLKYILRSMIYSGVWATQRCFISVIWAEKKSLTFLIKTTGQPEQGKGEFYGSTDSISGHGQTGKWDFEPWILSQWEHNAVTTEISQSH